MIATKVAKKLPQNVDILVQNCWISTFLSIHLNKLFLVSWFAQNTSLSLLVTKYTYRWFWKIQMIFNFSKYYFSFHHHHLNHYSVKIPSNYYVVVLRLQTNKVRNKKINLASLILFLTIMLLSEIMRRCKRIVLKKNCLALFIML